MSLSGMFNLPPVSPSSTFGIIAPPPNAVGDERHHGDDVASQLAQEIRLLRDTVVAQQATIASLVARVTALENNSSRFICSSEPCKAVVRPLLQLPQQQQRPIYTARSDGDVTQQQLQQQQQQQQQQRTKQQEDLHDIVVGCALNFLNERHHDGIWCEGCDEPFCCMGGARPRSPRAGQGRESNNEDADDEHHDAAVERSTGSAAIADEATVSKQTSAGGSRPEGVAAVTVGGEKVQHQVTMQTDLVELWHQIESATPFGSGFCWEKQWARCKEYWYGTDRLVGDLWFHFGCLCEPF